jgi:hypothetical protein
MRSHIPPSRFPLPASPDDDHLRQHFARLREFDRNTAPDFAQTCARARSRRRSRAIHRVRPVVIAAAAAVVLTAIWLGNTRSFSSVPVTPTIATWRAPTDVLLRTPGSELLGEMPALSASVLDKMIPTSTNRGT